MDLYLNFILHLKFPSGGPLAEQLHFKSYLPQIIKLNWAEKSRSSKLSIWFSNLVGGRGCCTVLQHPSPTPFSNALLQHPSPTPFSDALLQHPSPTPFSDALLQGPLLITCLLIVWFGDYRHVLLRLVAPWFKGESHRAWCRRYCFRLLHVCSSMWCKTRFCHIQKRIHEHPSGARRNGTGERRKMRISALPLAKEGHFERRQDRWHGVL